MKDRVLNPVLARELRQRMRGPRAALVLTVYLFLLSFLIWTVYEAASRSASSDFGGPNPEQVATLGRSLFQTLLFCVLLLVCFIVPGVTAGAIAGERERQTLVPLQVTLLRPRSILVGKLLASLAFVSLLIMATLPLAGISFLLGGVEPGEVVKGTAMVIVVAAVLACLSLLSSTAVRRTQGATVISYGWVALLTIGTFVLFGAQAVFTAPDDATKNQAVLTINPFMAVADVLDERADVFGGGDSFSPFSPFQALLRERQQVNVVEDDFRGQVIIDDNGQQIVRPAPEGPRRVEPGALNKVPFVLWSLLAYAGICAAALALAAKRIALPREVIA